MVKLKILVTGASGLVGHQLVKDLSSSSDVYSCYNKSKPEFGNPTKMDLLNHNMISDVLLETKPDVVIHLGAMTGVDLCEIHQDDAFKITHKQQKFLQKNVQK